MKRIFPAKTATVFNFPVQQKINTNWSNECARPLITHHPKSVVLYAPPWTAIEILTLHQPPVCYILCLREVRIKYFPWPRLTWRQILCTFLACSQSDPFHPPEKIKFHQGNFCETPELRNNLGKCIFLDLSQKTGKKLHSLTHEILARTLWIFHKNVHVNPLTVRQMGSVQLVGDDGLICTDTVILVNHNKYKLGSVDSSLFLRCQKRSPILTRMMKYFMFMLCISLTNSGNPSHRSLS